MRMEAPDQTLLSDKFSAALQNYRGALLGKQELSMISVTISVAVPNLADGVQFYTKTLGFLKLAEPVPGVAVLRVGTSEFCLLEKAAGSLPSVCSHEKRHYERHWTPVHMDFHVDDVKVALAKVLQAGAKQEQFFENHEHPCVAMCSEPFSHGFCLIERRK